MSFFRVLLALLISGGIAYGLYRAVDGKSLDRVVEAVRTEIAVPLGLGTAAPEGEEPEAAALAADTDDAEAGSESSESAETGSAPVAGTGDDEESDGTETAAAPAEQIADEEGDAEGEAAPGTDSASGNNWTAVVTASTGDETGAADDSMVRDPGTADETAESANGDTGTADAATDDATGALASGEGDTPAAAPAPPAGEDDTLAVAIAPLPDMPAQPAAPAADISVTAAETDGGETPSLPALAIGATTNDSIKALDVITGGMSYVEARATMIESGWTPRIPDTRAEEPNATEAALIEAGYGEIEGCREGERPLCRFEFVDGERRIAAVLTAGTGTDPSVIDAFLMNIRAE